MAAPMAGASLPPHWMSSRLKPLDTVAEGSATVPQSHRFGNEPQMSCRISHAVSAVVLASLLAACQAKPVAQTSPSALDIMEKVAVAANRCWFKSGDAAFKTYGFAPELTSFSGRPRILLTRKGSSDIRPLLVVQAEGKPARLSAFGPLMDEPLSGRISTDVKRWAAGNSNC